MRLALQRPSTLRLFAVYALVTLVPVIVLGAGLAISFRGIVERQGLAQGRSEATLIAQTAIESQLDDGRLTRQLSTHERTALDRLVRRAVRQRRVLRLRLRDLGGRVVFSDDGSGFADSADDEALDAARGQTVTRLTRLNADGNDEGGQGVSAVEVYLPLHGPDSAGRVGVLEIYLPYSPIAATVNAALRRLYADLGVGLAALYLALFAITLSVSRGLRREAAVNAFQARHDTLTALPNRAAFLERCQALAAGLTTSSHALTLAIIDLDHFKDINDTLGHQSGDQLLTRLASRARDHVREGDIVARVGGDEFGVMLSNASDPQEALERLRTVIANDIEIRGLTLSVEPSIGYQTTADPAVDVDVLLQRAEVAMHEAKRRHAGVLAYNSEFDHYDASSLGLIGELRAGIAADQLRVHFQPQLDLSSGRICALETLVRWQHPVHGLLYPDRFLPSAEQTDAIHALTEWVLDAALAEAARLDRTGAPAAVAVNVSARSIVRPEFVGCVTGALARWGVPADRLIIEVTETALLTDPERATRVLRAIADVGIRVSLDDFGQGQTSLSYLSTLPLDEIKIDRSFVTDMLANSANAAIVRSVIDLGHNLQIRVVAEGIETEDVLRALAAQGCDLAQGYHIARPMDAAALREWLAALPRAVTPVAAT